MLTRRIALVLRIGAVIFALSALALLLNPRYFLDFIGVTSETNLATQELLWAMRMMGLTLVIVSITMPVVAAFAPERVLRQVAVVVVPNCVGLSVLSAFAPGEWVVGRIGYVAIGIGFALGYLFALQGRRRNH